MKQLILLILILLGCESKPPTFDQILKQKLNKCVDTCSNKYLDPTLVQFVRSYINDPRALGKCLSGCYE